MPDTELSKISKRLDVVIALLLRMIEKDISRPSSREQISLLSELGLRPIEIANILGRSATYINKELAGIRKVKGR